jgi:hypothetical protein
MKLRDDLARRDGERRKQRRAAVPFAIVRPTLDLARPHGQQRMRAAQHLNLRFLIDAKERRAIADSDTARQRLGLCRSTTVVRLPC